jgi:hypothetical protein
MIDHMPTLPIEPIRSASASLIQAWPESGRNALELLGESAGACTGGNFLACCLRVKQRGAILGMQKQRIEGSFRGDAAASNYDVPLHIGEPRDSGFAAGRRPGMTAFGPR